VLCDGSRNWQMLAWDNLREPCPSHTKRFCDSFPAPGG
jgi:hypothetical protein